METKPDTSVVYVLPIRPNSTTSIFPLEYLGGKYGKRSLPKNWYNLGFKVNAGDTIYACRRGTVSEVVDDMESTVENVNFTREFNSVEISHKDCTFSEYAILKNYSMLVKVGQLVEVGDPLGIATGNNYTSGAHLVFSVYYTLEQSVFINGLVSNEKYYSAFVKPKFKTSVGIQLLQPKKEYISVISDDLIIQEMSKREVKKWAKKRGL